MMKFVSLIIVAASLLSCQQAAAQFSMSNLMALLTGKVSKDSNQEVKLAPRQRSVQVEQVEKQKEEEQASLLETLNLSYAGNMDFSRALDQV